MDKKKALILLSSVVVAAVIGGMVLNAYSAAAKACTTVNNGDVQGWPAATAGLRGGTKQVLIAGQYVPVGGDIIIAINGTRITNGDALSTYLEENTLPGQIIEVTVIRGNQTLTVPLILGTRP